MPIVSVDVDGPKCRTFGGLRLNIEQRLLMEAVLQMALFGHSNYFILSMTNG
jgi:hypothetical protein